MDFVAIDMEKLDNSPLSLCEIGIVKYSDGVCVDKYHTYILPAAGLSRNEFGKKTLRHISDNVLSISPSFSDVFDKIKSFIGDNLLVCHNKGADLNYIYYNEREYGLTGLYGNYIDLYQVVNKKLDVAYEEVFGKPIANDHHALDDAIHAAELFNHIQYSIDISKYIESDYIPVKEKPNSDNKKFDPVTIEGLVLEDDILADFDFFGKVCVVSGDSEYRNTVKDKLKSIGAKVVSGMSGSTNALIVSENVGPAKKEKALKLKSDKPDNFHVFTQQSVAKKFGII